jgi:hypothetical protein
MVLPKHRRTRVRWGSAQFGLVNFDIALHRMDQFLACIAGRNCLLRYLPQGMTAFLSFSASIMM